MGSQKRKTIPLNSKQPELKSLRDLSTKLTTINYDAFVVKYGNILGLLFVKVHYGQSSLTQFYDPPLRYFTFQDFRLA